MSSTKRENKQRNKFNFIKQIDSTLRGGFWKQIQALLVLCLICLGLFTLLSFLSNIDTPNPFNFTLSLFLDPGNLWNVYTAEDDSNLRNVEFLATIITIVGLVLMNGILISTFSNIIERRVSKVENGLVTYNLANHYIIIGYNNSTNNIIDELYSKETPDYKNKTRKWIRSNLPYMVILTELDANTVREKVCNNLPSTIHNNILVISGNIESAEALNKLHIDTAKELYILGDSGCADSDSKNLGYLSTISNLRGPKKTKNREKPVLKVNVHFENLESYSLIQRMDLDPQINHYEDPATHELEKEANLYIRPFNFYENWARMLWGSGGKSDKYLPLFATSTKYFSKSGKPDLNYILDADSKEHVHLVIVGFHQMGQALLLEALRICHYLNFKDNDESTKTQIMVIDQNMDEILPNFRAFFPNLDEINDINITFKKGRIEDEDIRNIIDNLAHDDLSLLTIAVCLSDSDACMAAGLTLPESVYYREDKIIGNKVEVFSNEIRTQVLIRQQQKHGIGNLLSFGKNQARYKNVNIFGVLDNNLTMAMLDDTKAAGLNGNYNKLKNGKPLETIDYQIDPDWLLLSEIDKWSNRYAIEMFPYYWALFERHNSDDTKEELVNSVAKVEHNRWMAERITAGWRQIKGNEQRMNIFQHHNCFMPYEQLSEELQEYDRNSVRYLIALKQHDDNQ